MDLVQSRTARLLEPLIVPAVFDFWAQKLNPVLSWHRCLARVVERRHEARDTVTLLLKANRHFSGYAPGQHLNVSVEVDGRRLTRSYSPVSIPDGRQLRITVRKVEAGKVSAWLVDRARVGDVLELGPAFGDMALEQGDGDGQDEWLMVAGGSGITPLFCQTQALLERNPLARVTLMVWAKTREDLCFHACLNDMESKHPGFRYIPVLTVDRPVQVGELEGRPHALHFRHLFPVLPQCRVRACGPDGFVNRIRELLQEAVADFRAESFSPLLPSPQQGAPVKVRLLRSGVTVDAVGGQSLLDALELAGFRPASGCRRGICNTCVCEKASGVTENLINAEQSAEAGATRLCVSTPRSDITLEL